MARQPEAVSKVSDQQVIAFVDDFYQSSQRYYSSWYSSLGTWYDAYRAVQRNPSEFRNNIAIPFIYAMCQSDVARKVQTTLGTWPIVTFSGYAPEDEASAKRVEVLVSAQMKDADSISKGIDFFLTADLYGTAIARYGWKNITRKNRIRRPETIMPGYTTDVIHTYDAELFNGPNWECLDPQDVKVQPGKKRIADMDGIVHEYWVDYDNLLEESLGPKPYYSASAVKRLLDYPMAGETQSYMGMRVGTYRTQDDYMVRTRFNKPIHIKEYIGLVPSEFAEGGIRARCIAIGNDRVVLKNRETPFYDQQKPFISYSPMPDPHEFYAPGKVELCRTLQDATWRLANQKLDILDHVLDPQYIMSTTAGINKDNLMSRAGQIILVDGAADDSNIRPLQKDADSYKGAYAEIEQLWQYMQLAGGINDILMGLQSGTRETARGVLTRQENTLTRLTMEAKLAEENFIEPLANAFHKMDQWWLPLPYVQKILGSMALVNPVTGLPYPSQPVTIDYDDMSADYRARAVGSSQQIGKSVRQQNFLQLQQIMATNPAYMQLVNWANMARESFQLFDFPNVNDFLVSTVPMVNQIAQQTGQSPESVAGMAASPLSQMNPNIIGQMGGRQNPFVLPANAAAQ